jgi:hypothetical protein
MVVANVDVKRTREMSENMYLVHGVFSRELDPASIREIAIAV